MPDNEIIRLIEKIRERYERVHSPSGIIPRIEADLMLADIRELYDKLSSPVVVETLLNTHKQMQGEENIRRDEDPGQGEADTDSIPFLQDIPEMKSNEIASEPVIELIPDQETIFPEPTGEHSLKSEPLVEPKTKIQTTVEIPSTAPEISVRSSLREEHSGYSVSASQGLDLFGAPLPTLADKLGEEKRSVNEKLHTGTGEESIGSKLRQTVTDLKTAIGINDRFLFINELFEGDMRVYDETLKSLNTCASLPDAISIFEDIKISRGWTDELESVDKLLEFIQRRYA